MKKKEFLKISKGEEYTIKTFKKGEFIYASGWNTKVGYILSGEVLASKYFSEKVILYPIGFETGDFIGINLYFFDLENDSYFDFIAKLDNTKVAFLENPLFEKLLKKTDFIRTLVENNKKIISNTLALTTFLMYGAIGYFAYILYFTRDKEKVYFDRFLDYCDYLNVNKSRLYEITQRLIKEGIITKEKNYINILDLNKLKHYFEKEGDS